MVNMVKINMKPLSVNQAWQGKRFKSPKYKRYEQDLMLLLPPMALPIPPYHLSYEFGFSNICSDIDNPIKPMTDILQKKYGFNDRDISQLSIKKTKVKKGEEFIYFNLSNTNG